MGVGKKIVLILALLPVALFYQNCSSDFRAPSQNETSSSENPPPDESAVDPILRPRPEPEQDVDLRLYTPAADATLENPYHVKRRWAVVSVDQTSNHHYIFRSGGTDVQVDAPAEADRKYPVPLASYDSNQYKTKYINYLVADPEGAGTSGTWDDVYRSEDDNHTNLSNAWYESASYDGVKPSNNGVYQLVTLQGAMVNYNVSPNSGWSFLPVNYSSQSYSQRGHAITSNGMNDRLTEYSYFFKSWLRGTPAFASYMDTYSDELVDNYIGLFGHSFQSLGRSGSELSFIKKMMLVGSYLDRDLKDILKVTGYYSPNMLALWRYNLPYADDQGNPLPVESEMLHRPAYASNGNEVSYEFADRNFEYHGYNDGLHTYRMIYQASTMSTPAPITILKTTRIKTYDGDQVVEDLTPNGLDQFLNATESVVTSAKTIATVIARDNRRVEFYVDLQHSVDLLGRPLTYRLKPIYFNQADDIEVQHLAVNDVMNSDRSAAFYRVAFRYDSKLPRTRMSVGIFSHNGVYWGQPVFLNVIFPSDNFDRSGIAQYYYPGTSDEKYARNHNKRPLIQFAQGNVIQVPKGKAASVAVTCTDPEGLPTRLYKWLDEKGKYDRANKKMTFTADELSDDKVENIRVICSDGTGGYSSSMLKLLVGNAQDETVGAKFCVSWFGDCILPDDGSYKIFYGRLENPHLKYNSKEISGRTSFTCDKDEFVSSDPLPGLSKACFYKKLP